MCIRDRHQPGAFVVVVGEFGRHRDVGHLEERVCRGAGEEEHDHPSGSQARGGGGAGEEQREADRQGEAGAQQEGAPASSGVGGAIRDAPGDRVEDCLLYTSDAADERSSVDLGGRRIIKKKTQ